MSEYTDYTPEEETLEIRITPDKRAEHVTGLKRMVIRKMTVELAGKTVCLTAMMVLMALGRKGYKLSDTPPAWAGIFYPTAMLIIGICLVYVVAESLRNIITVLRGINDCLAGDFGECNTPTSENAFRHLLHKYYADANRENFGYFDCLFTILLLVLYKPQTVEIQHNSLCKDAANMHYRTPTGTEVQFMIPEEILYRFFNKKEIACRKGDTETRKTALVLE